MADITHGTWIKDGKAVDKVFSNGNQVYGRNLYTDTQNFNNLALWNTASSAAPSVYWTKTTDTYNGLAVIQTTASWNGISQYIQVKKGDVLTYSVYAKYISGTGTSMIYWGLNDNPEGSYSAATANPSNNEVVITDSWQRVSETAVATSDGYLRPRIERSSNNTHVLQIAGIKVEKGSTATPWSPALEDVSDYGRNLLTGTGNHTVTGTGAFTADYLSNETTYDLLTLFKGLEGQTVTVSVDYNYSGFVAGSKTSRLGWETQINAGTPAYYGAWYSPDYSHNDSGSGRISYTFVVPINIISVGGSKGYIQFSGSGTGTLSHIKLEKGSVATPWTPAPEDVLK